MSGSIASNQISAIQGSGQQQQPSMLQTINGYQDLANKITQNQLTKQQIENAKLTNQTGQQALAQTMAERHAQNFASILSLPDQEIPGAASKMLDDELASGQIDQQRYGVLKGQIAQAGQTGDITSLKKLAIQGLATNMAAVPSSQFLLGSQGQYNQGPQTVFYNRSGLGSPNPGFMNQTSAITNFQGPRDVNVGGQIMQMNGTQPNGPALTMTPTTQEQNAIQTMKDPVTGEDITARNYQLGGMSGGGSPWVQNGGQAAPASMQPQGNGFGLAPLPPNSQPLPTAANPPRLPGSGVQSPQNNGPVGAGRQGGGGLLSNGPVTSNPQAIKAQQDNYTNFRQALDSQPMLKTNEQTLMRISNELDHTVTGPGSQKVYDVKDLVSTANQMMGGKLNQNDIDAANRDELGKDLNQLVSQAGGGAKFAGNVDAIIHGSPNAELNTQANKNVISLFLGKNRQQQLEVAMTKDQNSGRDFQQARNAANNLDPRALAIDTMTPTMQKETLAELKNDPEAMKKFYKTIAIANQYGMKIAPVRTPQARQPAQVMPPQNGLQPNNPLAGQ